MWTAGSRVGAIRRWPESFAAALCSGSLPPLAPLRARRSVGARWEQKEKARAGEPPRRATAGCSFATRRGSPASDTLEPGRGAMQGSSAARTTRMGGVRWHATAPTRARSRAGRGIARWYCPESHTTFKPSAGVSGRTASWGARRGRTAWWPHAEQAPSLAAAGDTLRRDAVELPGAMRWVERRVRLVHHVLSIVVGLLPEQLARCTAEMGGGAYRASDRDRAQGAFAPWSPSNSRCCPHRWGFQPHRLSPRNRLRARQHKMGPDPPSALA